MSGTIGFRADNPQYLKGDYEGYVIVGISGPNKWQGELVEGAGSHSVTVVNAGDTCLKPDGSGITGITIEGRNYTYLGLCLLPKGHDGECYSDVFYCDGPCNGTYPSDHPHPHVGNEDVTICEECNKPW